MDLVTSYSSDESEDASLKQPSNHKMSAAVSDLLQLDASFAQTPDTIKKDLENSRQLVSDSIRPIDPLSHSVQDMIAKSTSKEVDFLHLESGDSDDEQQYFHDNVNNLLNSAAILNDIVSGPPKPSDLCRLIGVDDSLLNAGYAASGSSGTNLSFLCNKRGSRTYETNFGGDGTNLISEADMPRKRLRTEFPSDKDCGSSKDLNVHETENAYLPKALMFRREDRVVSFLDNTISHVPSQITQTYVSHSSPVTALSWCVPQYSHLLLTASADCTLKVWDIFCKNNVQYFQHNLGLKAAKWSLSGEVVVTGGYGKKAHVYDVLSGTEIISYNVGYYLSSIVMHPSEEGVFLCGTHNEILAFDLRVNSDLPIRKFTSKCEEVLDMAFLDGNEFVCSTGIVSRDSADRTIMVWDFSSGAILSNQIFLERYTCPSLKVHPYNPSFVAQTNGDYIAEFSSQRPYKLKNKRFMGHKAAGLGIECDISPDGKYLASGDARGDIYFYNYFDSNLIRTLNVKCGVSTNKLKWHPVLPSTIATATWDGHVQIWK